MASFQREALTLSAEVFAVVGVADVVLRQLIALTNLATAAANASKSAREMRVRLQSLASAILSVRAWAESYDASDFVTQDAQRISAGVTETLLQCSTRLGAIFKNLHDVEAGSSGTLARFWAGLRFARDEKALQQSMNDLSTYTTALQIAMQSRQGTDLTILRRQQTLHAKVTADNHTDTLSRIDEIQQHQATTQNTIQTGFQDLITTLQLTYLDEDQVHVEGDNLSAGVDALRYLNMHLSHSMTGLSKSGKGVILPRDVAATLTGDVDKMIRYSQYCTRTGRNTALPGLNLSLSRRIHTIPLRTLSRLNDESGYITIEVADSEDPLGRRTQHIRFISFTVRPSGYGSAILGHLTRITLGDDQKVRRQMRVLNIIPGDSPVFGFAMNDDVDSLKKLFTTGKASILDYDEDGDGILWYAAVSLSWRTIHFLLDIGADATECSIDTLLVSKSIAWSIGIGVSNEIEHAHDTGNIELDVAESQLRLCMDFLQLKKTKTLETNTSAYLVRWTCSEPPRTSATTFHQERYFSILWDYGLGRRSIIRMALDPGTSITTFIATMTAWARSVYDNPAFSDTHGRTSLHSLLLALTYDTSQDIGMLIALMEAFTIDWKRVCRAAFYAQTFRDSRSFRDSELNFERALLSLLKSGVNPLQKDNEGVSAWDLVQKSAYMEQRYSEIFFPFITEERCQA